MPIRYHVFADSLPQDAFINLQSYLKGVAFLAGNVAGQKQVINLILNQNQTIEDLLPYAPGLKECRLVQMSEG